MAPPDLSQRDRLRVALVAFAVAALGCTDPPRDIARDGGAAAAPSAAAPSTAAPSASIAAASSSPTQASAVAPPRPPPLRCPRGMMRVAGKFCVDRWEASLVDRVTGMPLSPYYPPDRRLALQIAATWEHDHQEIGSEEARHMPVPELPAWQRDHEADPLAISKPGVKPNGYVSGTMAARACENAQKRLCRREEWVQACEGEAARPFPYGDRYAQGACNIFRATHPGVVLHDNPSIGHFDPRMNLVTDKDGSPLLRVTGGTPRCKSEWDGDAAWDMNGNLDEWVLFEEETRDAGAAADAGDAADAAVTGDAADAAVKGDATDAGAAASASDAGGGDAGNTASGGLFLGGFYSRSKRDGCLSSVSRHQRTYLDYSTGVRCCWSP